MIPDPRIPTVVMFVPCMGAMLPSGSKPVRTGGRRREKLPGWQERSHWSEAGSSPQRPKHSTGGCSRPRAERRSWCCRRPTRSNTPNAWWQQPRSRSPGSAPLSVPSTCSGGSRPSTPSSVGLLAGARFVYLVGDSPLHLRSVLKDTPLWDAIVEVLADGGVVAASGASAAAVCATRWSIPGAVACTLGLGLVGPADLVHRAETLVGGMAEAHPHPRRRGDGRGAPIPARRSSGRPPGGAGRLRGGARRPARSDQRSSIVTETIWMRPLGASGCGREARHGGDGRVRVPRSPGRTACSSVRRT